MMLDSDAVARNGVVVLIPPHCWHPDSGAASPNRAGAAHHLHGPAYRDGAALALTARKVDSDFGCTKSGARLS